MRSCGTWIAGTVFALAIEASAHEVVWNSNPTPGTTPDEPLVMEPIYYNQYDVTVQPNQPGEQCIVQVNLQPTPAGLDVTVSQNPALTVTITIKLSATAPPVPGGADLYVVGNWQATGQPPMSGCTGTAAFAVPVRVQAPNTWQTPNAGTAGDPFSTLTGELTTRYADLMLGGPLPFHFERSYGSRLSATSVVSALGTNWIHNFDARLGIFLNIARVTAYPGMMVIFRDTGAGWQLEGPQSVSYQLIAVGGGFDFVNPAVGLVYRFDANRKLASIRDRNGNTLSVTQGAAGPVTVADGLGRVLSFSYVSNRLTQVSDQSGRTVSFSYAGNNLATSTDANGKTTTYAYAGGAVPGLMQSAQLPRGNVPLTQQYDASGRVATQRDSFNNATALAFDQPQAGERKVTDPRGAVTVYRYAGYRNLVRFTDAAGEATDYAYDPQDRMLQVKDRLGRETDFAYDAASGFVAGVMDPASHVTTFTYVPQAQGASTFFNLSGMQRPDGSTISRSFDANGNIVGVTDQAANAFAFTYNARGQVLTANNPLGGVTTFSYNVDGTLASRNDPAGGTTTLAYDAAKRVSHLTFGDGKTRAFTYDARDRPLTHTDERGGVVQRTYDANGNIASLSDALGRTVTFAYDSDDFLSTFTDAKGKSTIHAWGATGLPTSITNAAGETTTFVFDALSRLVSTADPAGKGPSFDYDKEGGLVGVTDALGNARTFANDALGRVVAVTTPRGETFTRTFDSVGRFTSITDSLLRNTAIAYDNRGLVTGIAAPGNVAVAFAYDALRRPVSVTDPNGKVWSRQNDNGGRVVSTTDPLGRTVSYAFDARGRIQAATTPEGTLSVTRDAAGNVTRRQFSDGLDLANTFDANQRCTGGTNAALGYDENGRMTSSNGLVVTRDDVGRIATITYAPGKTVAYAYNARGLLASVSDWAGGGMTFAYDDAARLTTMVRASGVTTTHGYDANSRLRSITEAGAGGVLASITVHRDALGRVKSAIRNVLQEPVSVAGAVAQAFDAASQVAGMSYDGLGRITADAQRGYAWDLASRLKSWTSTGDTTSHGYDTFGLRTTRTSTTSASESYVLNYTLGLPSVATMRIGAIDERYYVYLPEGALLYAIDAATNTHRYYHFDEVGSTVLLTDATGTVTDAYGITPYGESVTVAGSTPNPFTWLGRHGVMQEGATGLYYMRARYFDSRTRRFLSRDPLRHMEPRAINPYQYAAGDPLGMVDATGMKWAEIENMYRSGRQYLFYGVYPNANPAPQNVNNYDNALWDEREIALNNYMLEHDGALPFAYQTFPPSSSSPVFPGDPIPMPDLTIDKNGKVTPVAPTPMRWVDVTPSSGAGGPPTPNGVDANSQGVKVIKDAVFDIVLPNVGKPAFPGVGGGVVAPVKPLTMYQKRFLEKWLGGNVKFGDQ